MNKSVWVDEVNLKRFKSLDGDLKTDVLIIGGGMAGVLCAYMLHNKGIDYALVEKDKIAMGITKNTTAKITSLHGLIYSKLVCDWGKEQAQMYLTKNEEAVRKYKQMCASIDCHFEERDAYTYSIRDRKIIEREVMTVNDLGFKGEFCQKTELPFEVKGAIKFKNQGQFNPLEFIGRIAENLNIYEDTFVYKIENGVALTNKGKIYAEKIIVSTHFPFWNMHGSYFLKLYQHRSYVTAFENVIKPQGMYVDADQKGMSFRGYKNMLLIGGGGHRTGKMGGNWDEIERFAKEHYPTARIKYRWATQDCMSLDSIPYIGKYSKRTGDVFVATGFNKWGMTGSLVASEVLSDLVLGKENEYVKLFSPSRKMLKMQLLANGFEATTNLMTPKVRRCPHLGCALNWNKAEHSWDCPCHGSRFDDEGRLIDNPAQKNADV